MNTGQSFLVIGALFIFSLTALSMNNAIRENDTTVTETQIMNGAAAAGLSSIEKAKRLAFDEATVAGPDAEPEDYTRPTALGAEPGEEFPFFDDVDDLHNHSDSVVTSLATYYVTAEIVYVDSNDMAVSREEPTAFKRMKVSVSSPAGGDTLRLYYIFSSWK